MLTILTILTLGLMAVVSAARREPLHLRQSR